jgi:phosphate acyltransferase
MRIALDAMGGDEAPEEIVSGAILAAPLMDPGDEIHLIGPEDVLGRLLDNRKARKCENIKIVNASEVIGMEETPVDTLRKKRDSSIAVMAKHAAKGNVDAVISAGNTGACVAACQMRMRNLKGVNRPGIAVVMPTLEGPLTLCDVGANVACKPINIYQYAVMASVYSREMFGIERPRVGLLSIGEEDSKGNDIIKRTREMLRADEKLNFIGNIEGRDIFKGVCDVAICEGFVGNIVLKLTEGLVEFMFKALKAEIKKENIFMALKFRSIMKRFYKKYDYHEYGGALLLGVNGTSMICHGSSKARTIKNAVLAAERFTNKGINDQIVQWLSDSTLESSDD